MSLLIRRHPGCYTEALGASWKHPAPPSTVVSYSLASLRRQERFQQKNNDENVTLLTISGSPDVHINLLYKSRLRNWVKRLRTTAKILKRDCRKTKKFLCSKNLIF